MPAEPGRAQSTRSGVIHCKRCHDAWRLPAPLYATTAICVWAACTHGLARPFDKRNLAAKTLLDARQPTIGNPISTVRAGQCPGKSR